MGVVSFYLNFQNSTPLVLKERPVCYCDQERHMHIKVDFFQHPDRMSRNSGFTHLWHISPHESEGNGQKKKSVPFSLFKRWRRTKESERFRKLTCRQESSGEDRRSRAAKRFERWDPLEAEVREGETPFPFLCLASVSTIYPSLRFYVNATTLNFNTQMVLTVHQLKYPTKGGPTMEGIT